jgi:signal recognition particle receptor subunit beta
VRCNTRIQKENTGGTLQTLAVALLLLLVLLLLLFSFPLRIYKGTQSTHTLKENTDVLMSQMYMALVNETVVEAVRVALDDYAMSHDTTPEVNALPGIITTAEEEVIHRAVLVGLQNLCRVQRIVSSTSSQQHTVGYDDRPLADDDATAAATRAEAAASLRKGFGLLMHNNTALQDVVHRVVTSIQAYLGESRQSGKRDGGAVAGVYSAAPEVTQMLGDAVEQQLLWNGGEAGTQAAAGQTSVVTQLGSFSAGQCVWLSATLLAGYLIFRLVFGGTLGIGATLNRRRRTRTALIGLPDSGKTALFGQLVRRIQLRETRTSMRESVGPLLVAKEQGISETTPGITIVDCPGHPRLRDHMLRAVGEAVNVVVVIDAVTVQDSQHDGVAALAELLLNVLQSTEFYGVQRLLFACTKRDEVTSYAAKAVRKLLEAAMVASIESRQNAMGRVESVRDSNNTVIASTNRKSGRGGNAGRHYVLSVDDCGDAGGVDGGQGLTRSHLRGDGGGVKRFSFEQLGIPVFFVDISSCPHSTEHKYSVAPIEAFILDK